MTLSGAVQVDRVLPAGKRTARLGTAVLSNGRLFVPYRDNVLADTASGFVIVNLSTGAVERDQKVSASALALGVNEVFVIDGPEVRQTDLSTGLSTGVASNLPAHLADGVLVP